MSKYVKYTIADPGDATKALSSMKSGFTDVYDALVTNPEKRRQLELDRQRQASRDALATPGTPEWTAAQTAKADWQKQVNANDPVYQAKLRDIERATPGTDEWTAAQTAKAQFEQGLKDKDPVYQAKLRELGMGQRRADASMLMQPGATNADVLSTYVPKSISTEISADLESGKIDNAKAMEMLKGVSVGEARDEVLGMLDVPSRKAVMDQAVKEHTAMAAKEMLGGKGIKDVVGEYEYADPTKLSSLVPKSVAATTKSRDYDKWNSMPEGAAKTAFGNMIGAYKKTGTGGKGSSKSSANVYNPITAGTWQDDDAIKEHIETASNSLFQNILPDWAADSDKTAKINMTKALQKLQTGLELSDNEMKRAIPDILDENSGWFTPTGRGEFNQENIENLLGGTRKVVDSAGNVMDFGQAAKAIISDPDRYSMVKVDGKTHLADLETSAGRTIAGLATSKDNEQALLSSNTGGIDTMDQYKSLMKVAGYDDDYINKVTGSTTRAKTEPTLSSSVDDSYYTRNLLGQLGKVSTAPKTVATPINYGNIMPSIRDYIGGIELPLTRTNYDRGQGYNLFGYDNLYK